MKSFGRLTMIFLALTLVLSGIAAAQDKLKTGAVDLKILPPAVLKAFQTAYPKAVIKGASKETENGVTLYEVESVDGQINRDLLYTADGKATEIEETVAPENLPAPVKQTLAKEYPGAKILKAEILTKDGVKLFELSIQVKDKTMGVTIDPQGRIEKTPAEEVKAKEAEETEKDEENEGKETAAKAAEIEETVALENLPAPVKQILAKEYPGAKILKAEILTKDGIKLFELSIQVKDKTVEVTIDPQGKIIK